jgi:hypothetical protein
MAVDTGSEPDEDEDDGLQGSTNNTSTTSASPLTCSSKITDERKKVL